MKPVQHTLDTPFFVGPVHCYSTEINGELTLFDAGPPTVAALNRLKTSLDLRQLKHVIITHCHIDHYGLAHWLERETDATIYIPFRDSLRFSSQQRHQQLMHDLLHQFGFDDQFIARFKMPAEDYELGPTQPRRFQIIEESDLPGKLGITPIPCPGHSQSDMVLVKGNWAVTGDILLRNIFQTPLLDVDLLTGQRFRNYYAYCDSLIKLAGLRDKTILPGHRIDIDSIDSCLLFYLGKMLERARRVKRLPLSMNAVETICQLLGDQLTIPIVSYIKASEIIFMRDFLAEPELLCAALKTIGLYPQLADKLAPFLSAHD